MAHLLHTRHPVLWITARFAEVDGADEVETLRRLEQRMIAGYSAEIVHSEPIPPEGSMNERGTVGGE